MHSTRRSSDSGRHLCRATYSQRVVVEAMGFDSDEYEAAKAVTHPRMAVLGDLVTLDRSEIDQDSASTKLLRVLDI